MSINKWGRIKKVKEGTEKSEAYQKLVGKEETPERRNPRQVIEVTTMRTIRHGDMVKTRPLGRTLLLRHIIRIEEILTFKEDDFWKGGTMPCKVKNANQCIIYTSVGPALEVKESYDYIVSMWREYLCD